MPLLKQGTEFDYLRMLTLLTTNHLVDLPPYSKSSSSTYDRVSETGFQRQGFRDRVSESRLYMGRRVHSFREESTTYVV